MYIETVPKEFWSVPHWRWQQQQQKNENNPDMISDAVL